MKHITFDESSVLREFAKIMHKGGLVKEAAEFDPGRGPGADPVQLEERRREMMSTQTEGTGDVETKMPFSSPQTEPTPQPPVTNQSNPLAAGLHMMNNFNEQLKVKYPNNPNAQKMEFEKVMNKKVQELSQDKRLTKENIDNFKQQALKLAPVASKVDLMTKDAKGERDKYYDVTGETGEQLVEIAHPGGGTRTELTHSKTDENLVETIVEQQKKDLEVARSVPKGTYATLMSLYKNLNKMGHKEHLGELKNVIKSIATADEVVEYTLVTLADDLDELGYRKCADRVDGMLVISDDTTITSALKRMNVPASSLEPAKAQVKKYMTGGMTEPDALAKVKESMVKGAQKKKLAEQMSSSYEQELKSTMEKASDTFVNNLEERFPFYKRHFSVLRGKPVSEALKIVTKFFRDSGESGANPGAAVDQKVSKLLDYAGELRKVLDSQQQSPATPVPSASVAPPPPPPPPPATPKRPKGSNPKVEKWQGYYNRAVKGTNLPQLKTDGFKGPKTRKAMALTRDAGSLKALKEWANGKVQKYTDPGPSLEQPDPYLPDKDVEIIEPLQAPAPTKQQALKTYESTLDMLEKKYARLKGKISGTGDEWRKLRRFVWSLSQKGKVTNQQIVEYLDIDNMNELRTVTK